MRYEVGTSGTQIIRNKGEACLPANTMKENTRGRLKSLLTVFWGRRKGVGKEGAIERIKRKREREHARTREVWDRLAENNETS